MATRDSRTPDDIRELKHQNNERLRNAFEEIFEKYARDFGNVGDEVDLVTGEIIVNNGHLERMRHEQDIGFVPPAFLRDWVQDVQVIESETERARESSYSDGDDIWEDVEEDDQEQDGQDAADDAEDMLMDELAVDERDVADLHSSRQNTSEPRDGRQPNIERERTPPVSPVSNQQRSAPMNFSSQPPFDRKIVEAFTNNIANQITDFIMYMASSIQQQVSNPSLGNAMPNQQRPNYRDFAEFESPPSKRRRFGNNVEDHDRISMSRSPSIPQNPLLKSSLQRLRLNPKAHAHRGITPGMPSLWSEDERDSYSRKKRRKTTGSNKAAAKLLQSSSLRNEVSLADSSLKTATHRNQNQDGNSSDESEAVFISSRLAQSNDSLENGQPGNEFEAPKKAYQKRLKRPFSTKDDVRMIELYYKGLNWEEISNQFPGTSKNQIRYHFQKNLAVGDTQTYEPRPDIHTPPTSPKMNGSEQLNSVDRSRTKPRNKSVTFAANTAPTTFPHPATPAYNLYTHIQPQRAFNHPHYSPDGSSGIVAGNLFSSSTIYGGSANAVPVAPPPPGSKSQRYDFGNEDNSEPVQLLQIPTAGPTS